MVVEVKVIRESELPLMEAVESSNIDKVGYNNDTAALFVQYKTGALYEYQNVDSLSYAAFRADSSLGSSLRRFIQPKFNCVRITIDTAKVAIKPKQDCVVLLSGGADSTTLLYHVVKRLDRNPLVISFNYGQRHSKELDYAAQTAADMGLERKVLNIDLGQIGGSPLTDATINIPKQSDNKQRSTVVPYRNMLLLTMAAAAAEVHGVNNKPKLEIYHGACLEDYNSYRDCRVSFIQALSAALSLSGTEEGSLVDVLTPFIKMDKIQITQLGLELGVNYEKTHTCYANMEPPCEVCDSCKERASAFDALGIKDPKVVQ